MTDASATPTHTAGHHLANLKVTTTEKATKHLYFIHSGASRAFSIWSPLKTHVISIANKTMGMGQRNSNLEWPRINHLCELSKLCKRYCFRSLDGPQWVQCLCVDLGGNCIVDNTIKPRFNFNRKIRQFNFVPYRGFSLNRRFNLSNLIDIQGRPVKNKSFLGQGVAGLYAGNFIW